MSGLLLPGPPGPSYAWALDSAALSLTASYDWRVLATADHWATASYLFAKGATTDFAYGFFLDGTGALGWVGSSNGSSIFSALSTTVPTFADRSQWWVRITYNFVSGAISFYYASPDPTPNPPGGWTSLGVVAGGAGFASFDNTQNFVIGALFFPAETNQFTGSIQRVQLRNNVADDGTGVVFDADFTKHPGEAAFVESSVNAATVTAAAPSSTRIVGHAESGRSYTSPKFSSGDGIGLAVG